MTFDCMDEDIPSFNEWDPYQQETAIPDWYERLVRWAETFPERLSRDLDSGLWTLWSRHHTDDPCRQTSDHVEALLVAARCAYAKSQIKYNHRDAFNLQDVQRIQTGLERFEEHVGAARDWADQLETGWARGRDCPWITRPLSFDRIFRQWVQQVARLAEEFPSRLDMTSLLKRKGASWQYNRGPVLGQLIDDMMPSSEDVLTCPALDFSIKGANRSYHNNREAVQKSFQGDLSTYTLDNLLGDLVGMYGSPDEMTEDEATFFQSRYWYADISSSDSDWVNGRLIQWGIEMSPIERTKAVKFWFRITCNPSEAPDHPMIDLERAPFEEDHATSALQYKVWTQALQRTVFDVLDEHDIPMKDVDPLEVDTGMRDCWHDSLYGDDDNGWAHRPPEKPDTLPITLDPNEDA